MVRYPKILYCSVVVDVPRHCHMIVGKDKWFRAVLQTIVVKMVFCWKAKLFILSFVYVLAIGHHL